MTESKLHILTGIKDVDLLIMLNMDDETLLNFCRSNRETRELCKNNTFWRNRYHKRFGKFADIIQKPDDKTWKQFYLSVIINLDKFKDPWSFFDRVSWTLFSDEENLSEAVMYFSPVTGELIYIDDEDDILENFYLLNLGETLTLRLFSDTITYKSKDYNIPYFTPYEILKLVYTYYTKPLNREEFEKYRDFLVEEYDLDPEEIDDIKNPSLFDMIGPIYFEGFEEQNGVHKFTWGT